MNYQHESCSLKTGLNALAKSFDPCQSAQFAKTDMGQNFSPFLNFLHGKGPFYIISDSVGCLSTYRG